MGHGKCRTSGVLVSAFRDAGAAGLLGLLGAGPRLRGMGLSGHSQRLPPKPEAPRVTGSLCNKKHSLRTPRQGSRETRVSAGLAQALVKLGHPGKAGGALGRPRLQLLQ